MAKGDKELFWANAEKLRCTITQRLKVMVVSR